MVLREVFVTEKLVKNYFPQTEENTTTSDTTINRASDPAIDFSEFIIVLLLVNCSTKTIIFAWLCFVCFASQNHLYFLAIEQQKGYFECDLRTKCLPKFSVQSRQGCLDTWIFLIFLCSLWSINFRLNASILDFIMIRATGKGNLIKSGPLLTTFLGGFNYL